MDTYERERVEAEKAEKELADKRYAAWVRNYGWPQVDDEGNVT